MPKSSQRAVSPKCLSCGEKLQPDAKFCHKCGARVGATRARTPAWKYVASALVLVAIGAGLLFAPLGPANDPQADNLAAMPGLSGQLLPDFTAPTTPSSPPPGQAQSVDLSTMSPREAADRLFNRVMMASESGNSTEAQQFVPMARQAYGMVPNMDADAHFHLGLIELVAGDDTAARQQIEALKQTSPNHLLGLYIAHEIAARNGDNAGASEVLGQFAAAYDTEIAKALPEYEAHGNTIERMRALASDTAVSEPSATPQPAVAETGEQLFQANCMRCHGPGATGSDNGPPLIHKYYEPSHHADEAFYRAVAMGVQSHHWNFGNMPPVPGVTEDQVAKIITYVRDLQEQAGIN